MQDDNSVLVNSLYGEGGRFSVSRTKLYEYLKTLGIFPFKKQGDRKGYITGEQSDQIDEYLRILAAEGPENAAQYAASLEQEITLTPVPDASVDVSTALAPQESSPEIPMAVQALAQAIAQNLQPPANPFAAQEALEQVAQNGWEVRTRQLKAVGIHPKEGALYGFNFRRVRTGWWMISKAAPAAQ